MRTRIPALLVAALLVAVLTSCSPTDDGSWSGEPAEHAATAEALSVDPATADAIAALLPELQQRYGLRSVIAKVTVDGETVTRTAIGESMTGVPATPDMRFRNGAVAISYMANLLLQLVDEGAISLDDPVADYLPDIPNADRVTVGQLARMTSGYRDYEAMPEFVQSLLEDPFQDFSTDEQLAFAIDEPLWFEPGTGWAYAHTNYVLLGLVLERVTGQSLEDALQERVLDPLGLASTVASQTAAIPEPALHAFDSERREVFEVPAGVPFYEESTYWNPSWTLAAGAVQTSTIDDLDRTAIAIGNGELLSAASRDLMLSKDLIGFGFPVDGCSSCGRQSEAYNYGIGVVNSGNWVLQNPMFGGFAAVEAYLPSKRIAISVAVTFAPDGFDEAGEAKNRADTIFREIAGLMAPDDAPPPRG